MCFLNYNISKRNGYCISNGFDFERVSNLKSVKEIRKGLGICYENVIGMVASFTPKKDWSTFIESAKIILSARNDVKFIVIGNGPLFESKTKLIDKKIINSLIKE